MNAGRSNSKAVLDAAAKRQKLEDAPQIDYSDIPALTEKQLTQFRRPPKKLVAVRLDADVHTRWNYLAAVISAPPLTSPEFQRSRCRGLPVSLRVPGRSRLPTGRFRPT